MINALQNQDMYNLYMINKNVTQMFITILNMPKVIIMNEYKRARLINDIQRLDSYIYIFTEIFINDYVTTKFMPLYQYSFIHK